MSQEPSTEVGTHASHDPREDEEDIQYRKRLAYIKNLLNNMTEDELTRFEFASQSHLRKARVRDVMEGACGPSANLTDEMVIVVSGLTKMFLSEVVDTALDVVREGGGRPGDDKIQVNHIREAFERMQQEGKVGAGGRDASHFLQSRRLVPSYDDDELLAAVCADDQQGDEEST